MAASSGSGAAGRVLGVPVKTSLGRGFLLRIRADGTTFVRLPWGVLYTMEVLTRGNDVSAALEDPTASNSESGDTELPTTIQADDRVDATPSQEGERKCKRDTPQPTGEA